jgi:hypothetical protein
LYLDDAQVDAFGREEALVDGRIDGQSCDVEARDRKIDQSPAFGGSWANPRAGTVQANKSAATRCNFTRIIMQPDVL